MTRGDELAVVAVIPEADRTADVPRRVSGPVIGIGSRISVHDRETGHQCRGQAQAHLRSTIYCGLQLGVMASSAFELGARVDGVGQLIDQ